MEPDTVSEKPAHEAKAEDAVAIVKTPEAAAVDSTATRVPPSSGCKVLDVEEISPSEKATNGSDALEEKKATSTPKKKKKKSATPKKKNTPKETTSKQSDESSSPSPKKSKKTYLIMAHEAIVSLGDRSGSSQVAIAKYIQSEYPAVKDVTAAVFRSRLGLAIKSGVKGGRFTKIKASYKINTEWKNKEKAKQRKKQRQRAELNKKNRLKRQEEAKKKRLEEKEKQRQLLIQKAHDKDNDMTEEERQALRDKLQKEEEARLAKEKAELLKKQIAERIRKRRFPIEDTRLHLEDKELGVKPPTDVKRRPALPTLFSCTSAPSKERNNSHYSFASKCEGLEVGSRGLVADMMQVYHFFCGDVSYSSGGTSLPDFTMKHLIYAVQEILNGNAKKSRMVPPLLSHLFVTALQWLLSVDTDAMELEYDDGNKDELRLKETGLFFDLQKLQQGLGPASWGEVCFQYMDAMERYYTTNASIHSNVLPGGRVDVQYLLRATDHVEQPDQNDEEDLMLPSGYGAYLGDAKSALSRAFSKLETKDPWNLTAEELMALLRALTDDVLASRPEISADIAKRDEEMHELLKAKRSADSQFRKIRLAYEGPKRPSKTKSATEEKGDGQEVAEERNSLESQNDADTTNKTEDDGDTKGSPPKFKPTASKRQFETAKKTQQKANDAYEKGLRKLVSRREPIGYDRNFNAVYFFNHDPDMLYVEVFRQPAVTKTSNNSSISPETQIRKSNWHVIETKSLFDQFVESLDIRGTRENELYEALMGPVGGSCSLRRFLFDDAKEQNEKVARTKDLEELQRRLANARIACAAEEEEGGRRSGRLASRAQIELSQVEHEIETLEKRLKEDETPKPVDYAVLTGLEALRKFDNPGRRETRRTREEAESTNLLPMPCSILWCTGNIDGTGIVGSVVSKLLELEEFCESLSPWERERDGRRAWIACLEDIVHAWNSGSPTLLGKPTKIKSATGDVAFASPGTPDVGSKRSAFDSPVEASEEKRRKIDSPASSTAVTNQSVPQILASLKPLLLELEQRVFEVTGLAMATRDADEADDNISVASNEDDKDAEIERRKQLVWKKKVYSLVTIPTSRYGQIREVLVEAIAAARKAHLSTVVAELRSALLLHHPNAAGECKAAALVTLDRHGGYEPDEEESDDESDTEDLNEEDEDEKAPSVLSGEAMMINGSLNGDENANRVDWIDAVKACKTVSRFAALVFAFSKNASKLLKKIQGEQEALYAALRVWEKEEERQKRTRGAKQVTAKKPSKAAFDTNTEVWTNVRFTDNFCMAKVENFPAWPAKRCEAKDPKLADSLNSVQRVLVSLVGEEGGLRVVKTEDISKYTGKPMEKDLSEFDKDMRTQLDECLAMARRIVRGRKNRQQANRDSLGCVEEKKSAI